MRQATKGDRNRQSLIPVTIKQLKNAPALTSGEQGFSLDGRDLYQVSVVGLIRTADETSTAGDSSAGEALGRAHRASSAGGPTSGRSSGRTSPKWVPTRPLPGFDPPRSAPEDALAFKPISPFISEGPYKQPMRHTGRGTTADDRISPRAGGWDRSNRVDKSRGP